MNKNFKNKILELQQSEEKLFLYSRFVVVSKKYSKVSKKQLSILTFNSQKKTIYNTQLLKTNVFWNGNNLSLLQKYLFYIQKNPIDNKKFKLKKTIKLLTLKNFLNLKKIETNRKIISKKNYLQKNNKWVFNLFQNLFNSKLELYKNNRQCAFLPFEVQNCYGILNLEKKKYSINRSSQQRLSKNVNIFYLSKKSLIMLNKKWQLFHNKKECRLTSQCGWICKPIKNSNIKKEYLNFSLSTLLYFIYQILKKKLKYFYYKHNFNSISIYYQFCKKNLIWLNYTFLKMIELVQNTSKNYDEEENFAFFYFHYFNSGVDFVNSNQLLESLKNKKEKLKKNYNYYWYINRKARFVEMKQSYCYFFNLKNNYKTKKELQSSPKDAFHINIDNIFCIVKVQEFVMNNYQNLSYFSSTNLLFSSKRKLLKILDKTYQSYIWWKNKGLILKSQYNSIILNRQKLSKKLISKLPNLEITFEQHLNVPSNKLINILYSKNNYKTSLTKSNKNSHFCFITNSISHEIQLNNIEKNTKILNNNFSKIINKNYNIFKFKKPVGIFRYFLGFSIPINFDFSFQSSNISWNFFPDYNLSNLKFEKKLKSIEYLTYLIFKNKILNSKAIQKSINYNAAIFTNISDCIKMLLRQPCIYLFATEDLNMGYRKNIFLAPTQTLLLLSPQNYLNNNNPIALTKIYSGIKGEILNSLKNKKSNFISLSGIKYELSNKDKFVFHESFFQSERSIFLTKSDQICLKFKNEIILNNELNFVKKFNIFKNHKHIRSLKSFQIKSVKQIIFIFKILQKIHNNCQFINQAIQIGLGQLVFQGDLLNSFFIKYKMQNESTFNIQTKTTKIQKSYMKSIRVNYSGQIIHLNKYKLTLRKGQPLFFSPNCIFYSYNNDFIKQNQPVLSLPYQQLKTGDIVQGIPKIEQLFEARLTFAGKLEYDNLTNILEILFQTYKNKLQLKLAVRRSIELIQMIIINSIQRIYRSQGVNISDKHLEVIVKQMTKKVEIIDSGQSGFLIGEHFDLDIVELWNSKLSKNKHVKYKPLILGISKASLQTDSFLSAASFQYTTRILSQAAFLKKRDFLKGLKENIVVGNIIPAGTGYLGNIEDLFKIN